MSAKPILFSSPMVRALLAGTKTQTRRIIKPQPKLAPHHEPVRVEHRGGRRWVWMVCTDRPSYQFATGDWKAPYAIGDLLYVREHWRVAPLHNDVPPRDVQWDVPVHYVADGRSTASLGMLAAMSGRFRQGMHMPRWASRITLTVTDVRVERLQDISEDDALAEGIVHVGGYQDCDGDPRLDGRPYMSDAFHHDPDSIRTETDLRLCPDSASRAYRQLWNVINGDGSWNENPWIAAYSFRVHFGNIDQMAGAA